MEYTERGNQVFEGLGRRLANSFINVVLSVYILVFKTTFVILLCSIKAQHLK